MDGFSVIANDRVPISLVIGNHGSHWDWEKWKGIFQSGNFVVTGKNHGILLKILGKSGI